MRAPEFWQTGGLPAALLAPLSGLYAAGASLRTLAAHAYRPPVPVVCIGNLVAGGAGKTQVALAIGAALVARGVACHFLTRGYGGRSAGPVQVDPGRHDAEDVGDEPLLLARIAPTWVARDRAEGAASAAAAGAELIVMDDGFQNPSVVKDLSLVVVDGETGFGNERLLPAGPLRETVASGLARADAVVVVGPDRHGIAARVDGALPVFAADIVPADPAETVAGRPVLAFAGIARPEKFYRTLGELGCTLVATHDFPDHHRYRGDEIMRLVDDAAAAGALPVTTEKDHVRLPAEARGMVHALRVTLAWREPERLAALISPLLRTDDDVAAAHAG